MWRIAAALCIPVLAASAATAASVTPPEGLCLIEPAKGGYRAMVWQRFSPPGRGAVFETLAIDCASLQEADAGRPDRPHRLFNVLVSDGEDGLPKELNAFLDEMERRFRQRSDYLGRDDLAVYTAQRVVKRDQGTSVNGASAFTTVGGRTRIVTAITFGAADEAAAKAETLAAVRQLHHR